MRSALFIAAVALALSALQLVQVRHHNRAAFMHIQQLIHAQDVLNEEWGRLLVEQSTWTTRRIGDAADKMGLRPPRSPEVVYLAPRPTPSVAAAGAQP